MRALLIAAGATFMGNLVALIAVVNVFLTPIREDVRDNRISTEIIQRDLSDHEQIVGHEGTLEIVTRIESNVRWLREHQEEDQ